jgi:hypothetical protein
VTSLDRGTNVRGTGRAAPAGRPRWRAFALLAAVPVAFLLIRRTELARAATR